MLVLLKLCILDYRKFQVSQKENTPKVDGSIVCGFGFFKIKVDMNLLNMKAKKYVKSSTPLTPTPLGNLIKVNQLLY